MGKLWIVIILFLVGFFVYGTQFPSSQLFGLVEVTSPGDGILLTFDDGPGEYTAEILDILDEYNVSAIFFVIGNKAKESPIIVNRIVSEGHLLGVHSMSHKRLWSNNDYEIGFSKTLLENLSNTTIKYFRPPYGFRLWTTLSSARGNDLITMMWDVFPRDYVKTSSDIYYDVIKNTRENSIICLHDGNLNSNETVNVLPHLIEDLKSKGYDFINPVSLDWD